MLVFPLNVWEQLSVYCNLSYALQMFQMSNAKIVKSGGAEPDQLEGQISQALVELEMNSDLKTQLRELHFTKAKEIELNGKKVILL